MTATQTASHQITEEVTSWPCVQAEPGKRGELRDVIALLRLNYDRAVARHGLPREAA